MVGWIQKILGGTPEFDFLAVDVETAARERHSICQIGIVGFRGGRETFAEESLIDPGCAFENTAIHGLTALHVKRAPSFSQLHGRVSGLLSGRVVVSHSKFDVSALGAACAHHGVPPIEASWVDSVVVARSAWPELADHRLPTVAAALGHEFRHHSALEDARASGTLFVEAMRQTGRDLEYWMNGGGLDPRLPKDSRAGIRREGGSEGALAGSVVVLTGDFSAPKGVLADQIAGAGGAVASGVNKKTTILVTGERDADEFAGKLKSGKQLRAEELLAAGHPIEIITEAQLRARLRV